MPDPTARRVANATTTALAALALLAAGPAGARNFRLVSSDFKGGRFAAEQYFDGSGCGGANASPPLHWNDAPSGTKSFVVTILDVDAGFWHWGVANIPSATPGLEQGSSADPGKLPDGTLQIVNDYGRPGYGGPCPPPNSDHHYRLTVFALKVDRLDVDGRGGGAALERLALEQAIDKATLTIRAAR